MPYRFEREHWHIPKQYDRRTKLTDGQRQEIQQLYTNGTTDRQYQLAENTKI